MALYAISDLHLSLGTNKPMDIFSSQWEGHAEKLKRNWLETIKEEDTVIIPGDVSWATYLEDALEDFQFLNMLPGRKIISKGNHDYWWTTIAKMNRFLEENRFLNLFFLHNNYFEYEDWIICGTRGWSYCDKGAGEEDEKIFNREQKRLEFSLEQGEKAGRDRIITVLHYPPFSYNNNDSGFIKIMKDYNVSICVYGHLHGDFSLARQGIINGIEFKFVSSDYLDFKPCRLM